MTLNIPDLRVVPDLRAVQYDGANGAYVAGCFADGSVMTDTGTQLVVSQFSGVFSHTIDLDSWVVLLGGYLQNIVPDATFLAAGMSYAPVLSTSEVAAAMDSAIAGIEPVNAAGIAAVPSLGASAQAVVSVTLTPAMGGTGYSAAPALIGGNQLLGALSILSHSIVDEDTVNVTVKNTGLLTLAGAQVLVVAVA